MKINFSTRLIKINLILLVILAAALPYLNSLSMPELISDDSVLFKTDSLIRDLNNWEEIIAQGWWQDNYVSYFFLYRPLTVLTFAVNFVFGQLSPFSYHLINLLLHVLNSLLVFWLIKKLFKKTGLALVAALLFAVHPVHTEAVDWLVGRAELLSFLFVLSALIFYLKYRESQKAEMIILSLIFFLLSLFSKENSVVLLPLLILLELFLAPLQPLKTWFKGLVLNFKKVFFIHVFFWASAGGWLVWRAVVADFFDPLINSARAGVSFIGNNPLYFLPFWERFINSAKVLVFYALKLLVWPVKQAHLYYFNSIPVSRGFDFEIVVSLLIFGLLAFLTVYWLKSRRDLFLASGWFLVAFIPFSNMFYPISVIFAERLLYLPSVGFCLLLALFFDKIYNQGRRGLKVAAVILLSAVLLLGAFRTYQRNFDWHSGRVLDQKTLKAVPQNTRVLLSVAINLIADGRLNEAASHLEEILKISPDHQLAGQLLEDVRYELNQTSGEVNQ